MKLSELYDDLPNHREIIWNHVDHDDFDREFNVVTLDPVKVFKTWRVNNGETTIEEAYKQFASKEQRQYVQTLRKKRDLQAQVLVVSGTDLLDGFHRLVALAKNKVRTVQALDVDAPT